MAYSLDDKTVAQGRLRHLRRAGGRSGASASPASRRPRTSCRRTTTASRSQANLANPFPAGVADPPGASLGRQHVRRPRSSAGGRPTSTASRTPRRCAGPSASSANCRTSGWSRPPTSATGATTWPSTRNSTRFRAATCRPARRATRRRSTTSPTNVTNPFRGLLPGTSLNGSTVQRQQLLRPYPAVRGHPEPRARRHQQLQRPAGPRREAVHERLHAPGVLHLVEVHRAGVAAERHRPGVRRAAGRRRHAAPAGRQRHLGAALRPRQEVGLGLERRAERGRSAAGASRPSTRRSRGGRSAPGATSTTTGTWSSLKADYSKVKDGLPIFDTSGLLLPRRRGADQRRGRPGKAARRPAHPLAQNIRYFPTRLANCASRR